MKKLLFVNILGTVLVALIAVGGAYLKASQSNVVVCPPQSEDVILIPNPNNCSEFFECQNGVPVLMCCPDGLYFCDEKDTCAWIWDEECTFGCVVGRMQSACDGSGGGGGGKCWDAIKEAKGQSVNFCGSPCPQRIEEAQPSFWASYVNCK